ncbi:hypothetical protein [Streptomyces sp. NPDC059489]
MRSTSAATALAILTGSVAPSVAAVEPVPAEPAVPVRLRGPATP